MPSRPPFALRYAEFLRTHPKAAGALVGVLSGLLSGAGTSLLLVLDDVSGLTSAGGVMLGVFVGVVVGPITGVIAGSMLRGLTPPPLFAAQGPPINRAQLREARRLARRGAAADDPDTARLAAWQAQQHLRWQRPSQRPSWRDYVDWRTVFFAVMLLVCGGLLVGALRAGNTGETLFRGFSTLFWLFGLASVPWTNRLLRRARSALEANTAVVEAHEAERARQEPSEFGAG
ncbi:hypothetical protein F4561_004423 [Lipingzhangella halophila]|uniref:Uncharacterized protein n=1 Tax=Lipingzhangella halophila TaxID=1783352 RepID=A0A7W7RKC5_9ACTN|nr:hypothetical protein [Lipingzhangella halophila]MBB4933603.1 hypothetical protein [Lipingzhangella halophila]